MPRVVRPESSSEDEEGAGTSSGRRTKKKSASPQSQTLRQGTRSHLSQSQLSQSQSQRPHHQLFTEEDVARKVADCVVFILAQERKRAPIKKADVLKAVELTGRPKELQDRVFVRARDKLAHIFGMELVESPDQSKKGIFFLLNAVESQGFCVDEAESARLGALFCVLGLLLMSNGHATDQEVISFLRMLGFPKFSPGKEDEEAKNLLLREWGARQQYLDIAKVGKSIEVIGHIS